MELQRTARHFCPKTKTWLGKEARRLQFQEAVRKSSLAHCWVRPRGSLGQWQNSSGFQGTPHRGSCSSAVQPPTGLFLLAGAQGHNRDAHLRAHNSVLICASLGLRCPLAPLPLQDGPFLITPGTFSLPGGRPSHQVPPRSLVSGREWGNRATRATPSVVKERRVKNTLIIQK